MTNADKLLQKKNRLALLEDSPKNIKCPGVLRKLRREVRNLEKKIQKYRHIQQSLLIARMAQLVERKPFKFNVTGSNPVFCTKAVPSICGRGGTAYAADLKSAGPRPCGFESHRPHLLCERRIKEWKRFGE